MSSLIQDRTQTASVEAIGGERGDLLQTLRQHRGFLRFTAKGLTDEQARARTTVSELTVGGLIKHVSNCEAGWALFMVGGAELMATGLPSEQEWAEDFRMTEDETLEGLLAGYEAVAAKTDELIATLDLDAAFPLPEAPWFESGVSWSVRRVVLHILAETTQHAGHADVVREAIDGQKTMG
ncbi:DinB family protein [Actinokineospora pegani]|uniref:DinB family protein n=1 Tax=Actinokineospora pegani TaxID=2654637 RepID=UPI0012EA9E98|nr:DinB family protein [Actinokineospora pegani]